MTEPHTRQLIAEHGSAAPLLDIEGLSKNYGRTRVLSGIDVRLEHGQSIALIGENGAGKSTFAKILTGVIRRDAGEIRLEGVNVEFGSPRDALAAGIAFIPQELAYVPQMTVAENILLGQWPAKAGLTTRRASLAKAQAECRRLGIDLGDLSQPMAVLKLADRQVAEIVKALIRRARVIILDEPTASLSRQESLSLFAVLNRLTAEGVGIIYISHRMDEVYDFSDLVVVLRNGEQVATVATAQTTHAELIAQMLGQEKGEYIAPPPSPEDRASVAEITGWSRTGMPSLVDVSLKVGGREIVGLYGVRGSGADLLAEGLGGLKPDITGTFQLRGRDIGVPASPLAANRNGIAYVPAERKRDGLVLQLSVGINLVARIFRQLGRLGFVGRRRERAEATAMATAFDIRFRSLDQPVSQLSGGNQQKILLASRLADRPSLLVLHEPTRGVDVGARLQIHRFLSDIARKGCPLLMVTSDLEEAVAISDRLLVMRDGRVVGELSGEAKTQSAAIALAAGEARDA